ncbi:SdpA family antimicrobial peptide system protein [Cryobacterium lactosi]|nr:SdpA family antimicrobial peptide system protein [Cryobacterium lactosi]
MVQTILPEQWGFFTKSPREDMILPYTHSQEAGWASAAMYPHAQAQYAFGWNRVSRAQGVEVGLVYKEVVDGIWTDCTDYGDAIDCLDALSDDSKAEVPTVANLSPDPTLCGLSAFSKAPPAPWAYANIGQAKQRISITLVEITC